MTKKTIYQIAQHFETQLKKRADSLFPTSEKALEIIKNVFDSYKSNPLFKEVVEIGKPDVQNTIDNTSMVYFQLIVKPQSYEQLINEPEKTQLTSLLKPAVEEALKNAFGAFNFKVKIGIVPV